MGALQDLWVHYLTPVQQLTAPKENKKCYEAVSDNNTKHEDYAKLQRKVN